MFLTCNRKYYILSTQFSFNGCVLNAVLQILETDDCAKQKSSGLWGFFNCTAICTGIAILNVEALKDNT